MNRKHVFFGFIGVFLIIGSVFVFLIPAPEYFQIQSQDHVMTVTGRYIGDRPEIVSQVAQDHPVFSSQIYTVSQREGQVQFTDIQADILQGESRYTYDEFYRTWRLDDQYEGMKYAIGTPLDVLLPNFASMKSDLLELMPQHATGYQVFTTVHFPGTEGSFLIGDIEQQGCLHPEDEWYDTQRSMQSQSVHILVNDVQTLVEVQYRAIWSEKDMGVNCSE